MSKEKRKKNKLGKNLGTDVKSNEETIIRSDDFIMKPKVDFCFKEIMQNPDVRKGFISAILGISPDEIKETRLLPTLFEKHQSDDKIYILDVRVELNSKQQIDMEMQVGVYEYWRERSTMYLSKMYVEQLNEGEEYSKLEKCIHIGIVNFELFPDEDEYYSRFHMREDNRNILYTDKLELHVIELPKVRKKNYPENDILHWTNFFNVETKKELEQMKNKNEYIDIACDQVLKVSADEEKRILYDERVKAIRDINTQLNASFENGKKEGIKEGEVRGQINMVIEFFKEDIITLEMAMGKTGMTKEEFLEKCKAYEEEIVSNIK